MSAKNIGFLHMFVNYANAKITGTNFRNLNYSYFLCAKLLLKELFTLLLLSHIIYGAIVFLYSRKSIDCIIKIKSI